MILRTPGRTIRVSLSTPLPFPSRGPSMLIRSTSSAVSGICCLAVSIIRCAIGIARATDSAFPLIVSVSPRSAIFAPVCFASSIRFSSFTPASVSMSAPSVERR